MITVNAVQKMLKKQFTEANGLQDPVLRQGLNFQVYRSIPFVQVLHDGRIHWVAISSYGCDQGKIYLMGSLFNGRIAEHTKEQIYSILNCAARKIKVNISPVQQQSNGVDCGIYALAFCFYILSKTTNPINVFFIQGKLRSHFLYCLTANKMTHFPMLQTATKTCVAKTVTINVFCSCRMPWKKSEVFMKDKWLHVVNGFTECVNESQMLCFAKKIQNANGCVISAHQIELKPHVLK